MIRKEDLFKAGRFLKPHGFRGEITLLTDYLIPEQIQSPYLVCEMDGIPVPFFTENYRPKGSATVIVKLENVDSETVARRLSGRDVYYPLSALTEDENGETGLSQLEGYIVESDAQGEIGAITGIDDTTLNVLLRVDYQGNELLIPAAEELIVSIDHQGRRLKMKLPEGITEI